jgi:competence protein ComEA
VLGQVKNPGVYALRTPVLVIQAIELAGGLTADADLEYVHKVVPLSVMVKPEQKIYIPGLTSSGTSSALQDPGVNLVNLNTSSKTELMDIAGVGDVTANKIISIRPISNWDQVQQIPNLSSTTFQEIKKRAVL